MIKIVHAYPSLMNLYGEYANIKLLVKRLEAAGEDVTVLNLERGMHTDIKDSDFLFVGAGTELKMLAALEDIKQYKEDISLMLENGGHVLATGNAGALFMNCIEDKKYSGSYEGVGFLNGNCTIVPGRRYSEVICETSLVTEKVIGVINSSVDFTYNGDNHFCRIVKDSDKRLAGTGEGFIKNGIYTTELTGPILYRNPALLEFFASMLAKKDLPVCQENWWIEENEAYKNVSKILEESIS